MAVKLNILIALLALALAAFATMPTRAGSFEDGLAAYERGDFAMAYRLFRPLAEQGNARAQYNLGFIYATGPGATHAGAPGSVVMLAALLFAFSSWYASAPLRLRRNGISWP